MYTAGPLSHACACTPAKGNKTFSQINAIQNADLNPADVYDMQIATTANVTLQTLLNTVKFGCPDKKEALPALPTTLLANPV